MNWVAILLAVVTVFLVYLFLIWKDDTRFDQLHKGTLFFLMFATAIAALSEFGFVIRIPPH